MGPERGPRRGKFARDGSVSSQRELGREPAVTASVRSSGFLSESATDALATALFVGFVSLLFLGYLYSSFPYGGLAAIPLFGALATVFWANLQTDRSTRSPSQR